jgi:gas vesicle protein
MCGFVDSIADAVGGGGGGGLLGGLVGGVVGALLGRPAMQQPDTSALEARAQANADRAYQQADEAKNRANAKSPNVQNLLAENIQAALGGSSSTMLTGPQGVDPKKLALGQNTLLGQ